jgi:hypothetical protein
MRVRLMCLLVGTLAVAACSSPTKAMPEKAPAVEAAGAPMAGDHAAMPHEAVTGDDLVKLALSAGPADITARAAVVDMDDQMHMKEIRPGTNGWACMAHPEVMCVDKEWQAFLEAYASKKDPHVKGFGIGYMLSGDQGASNTDPFAMKPTADNHWVISPPHIMILTPDTKTLDGLPTDFASGGPWVMWKGTKYAHIMVPTTAMAAGRSASN